jgi:radical SAM protein with 4Fe4S-binding SPASM domain
MNKDENELSTREIYDLLDQLRDFGCPVVLFSGGEPLMHPDIVPLAEYTVSKGMRAVISSNGTLLNPDMASKLSKVGLSYIGISLDGGIPGTHDPFRGIEGSFERALEGLRNARKCGIKTGIRFTITKNNGGDIIRMFDLVERENIPRICFYHFVSTGRGKDNIDCSIEPKKTREIVDLIIDHTSSINRNGNPLEVLTVDNHCDGPYIYLRLLSENPSRAVEVLELLELNGGNNSGVAVACIGWDGTVYPDQFWRTRPLGSIREKPFKNIWTDKSNIFLRMLKDKKRHVTGRCSRCKFLSICGGNFRARADAETGDPWASDPACYLTDEEIGI